MTRFRRFKRLRVIVDAEIKYLNRIGWRNGCLIGNFSAEASEHSEVIRKRIVQIFKEMRPGGRGFFESGGEKRRPITQERLR